MTTKTSPLIVKKESCSDDIKDFAENAMNELLGWYGYDKINQNEIKPTTSKKKNTEHADKNESSCSNSGVGICDDSEYESLCDSSKGHYVLKSLRTENNCNWCRRTVPLNSTEILGSPDGPVFCSESCFSQSRRANFKRAKICDWCKHVRHAVNYVDFQDTASQLQFCSDKCLNQYKMQIFCNETQAHLDMNPHLKEKTDTSNGLITPELWLKNCRSRSQSPLSDQSRTPSPQSLLSVFPKRIPTPLSISKNSLNSIKKPIITVAPVSKLLNKNLTPKHSLRTVKRRKRSYRPSQNTSINNNINMETNNNNRKSPIIQDKPTMNQKSVQPEPSQPVHVTQTPLVHPQSQMNYAQPHPLMRSVPPVTILVPYPLILPLVIPIPIILKSGKDESKSTNEESGSTSKTQLEVKNSENSVENVEKNEDIVDKLIVDCSKSDKDENAEQKLPKFKITRLSSKRNLSRECEKEKNRPLRKRKFDQHQIIELDDEKTSQK